VIIDKQVFGVSNNFALENGRGYQTMPAIRLGMPYLIRLYDRASTDREAKIFRKSLGHGVRDGVKPADFISRYGE